MRIGIKKYKSVHIHVQQNHDNVEVCVRGQYGSLPFIHLSTPTLTRSDVFTCISTPPPPPGPMFLHVYLHPPPPPGAMILPVYLQPHPHQERCVYMYIYTPTRSGGKSFTNTCRPSWRLQSSVSTRRCGTFFRTSGIFAHRRALALGCRFCWVIRCVCGGELWP